MRSFIVILVLVLSSSLLVPPATASDPDPVQDFCVARPNSPCKPPSSVTSDDFFSSVLTPELTFTDSFLANVSVADVTSFPALNTLGISIVRVIVGPSGLVQPHTHPRSTELILVIEGRLLVGLFSSDGRYFSKTVGPGELFVIPRGLIHFQYNFGKAKVVAVAAFNSQLVGVQIVAKSLFGSVPPVPDAVLTKAFGVEQKIVEEIRAKFA